MNYWFTWLVIFQILISGLVTLSWLFSGIITPWDILVYVVTALEAGAYLGILSERTKK